MEKIKYGRVCTQLLSGYYCKNTADTQSKLEELGYKAICPRIGSWEYFYINKDTFDGMQKPPQGSILLEIINKSFCYKNQHNDYINDYINVLEFELGERMPTHNRFHVGADGTVSEVFTLSNCQDFERYVIIKKGLYNSLITHLSRLKPNQHILMECRKRDGTEDVIPLKMKYDKFIKEYDMNYDYYEVNEHGELVQPNEYIICEDVIGKDIAESAIEFVSNMKCNQKEPEPFYQPIKRDLLKHMERIKKNLNSTHYLKYHLSNDLSIRFFYRFDAQKVKENKFYLKNNSMKSYTLLEEKVAYHMILELVDLEKHPCLEIKGSYNNRDCCYEKDIKELRIETKQGINENAGKTCGKVVDNG